MFHGENMQSKELAALIGISHQLCNRYKAKGMPTDSFEAAKAWYKANINPFRSKTGRIGGGNTGKKYQPTQAKEAQLDSASISWTLTRIVPDLWFSQIQRLGTVCREHDVIVSAETLARMQGLLFLLYQIEVDRYLDTEALYDLPDILMIKPDDAAYPSLINALSQTLNEARVL